MDDEKSYFEIKVTFHHILILLVGVIIIGVFLFYLGYQAGKSASGKPKDLSAKGEGQSKEIEVLSKKDPDRIDDVDEPSINEEIRLHQQPAANAGGEEIKTAKSVKREPYFAVQVAAFNSHTLAQNYSRKFSRAGYPTSISQAMVKGKLWYRVRVGNFKTRDKARREKDKLEKLENKKFTVVKSN